MGQMYICGCLNVIFRSVPKKSWKRYHIDGYLHVIYRNEHQEEVRLEC